MRITNKILTDVAIWMSLFGVCVGIIFPFFILLMGVSADIALQPMFFGTTLCAGLIVGGVNYLIVRSVIRPRLRFLSEKMGEVAKQIDTATYSGDWSDCSLENCALTADSNDEIGSSASSFNGMLEAFGESRRVEEAVSGFTQSLSTTLDFEEMMYNALTQMLDHTHAQAGAIAVEASGELEISASIGVQDADTLLKNDHLKRVFKLNQEVHFELPENIVANGLVADFKPREVWVLPVDFGEVAIAAVTLVSANGFRQGDLRVARLFRQGLGLAIQNALSHRHLQRVAALDALTGAYNRRFGLKRLHEELARAKRANGSVAVIMFDIDHFKNVNDTYGHLVGDRVIVSVCRAGQRMLRDGDTLIRYGGEEFCAVLPGATKESAVKIAERMRHAVEETVVDDGEQRIHVTISAGVSDYPTAAVENESQLLDLADKNLYRAKQNGRNCVQG